MTLNRTVHEGEISIVNLVESEKSATPTRVVVLYGGQSPEHAVSCVTAAGVLGAIDSESFDVIEIGITAAGQWTRPVVDPRTYTFSAQQEPHVVPHESSVVLHPGPGGSSERACELVEIHRDGTSTSLGHVDVVLPLLHGPFGEDGTIQGMLEVAGVPYVGAGVMASAVGMDKHLMKIAFASAGLTVGPYEVITAKQWTQDAAGCVRRVKGLELPVFVKPARGGSSVGITRIDDWSQLSEALAAAQAHDPKVIVEAGIAGREIECGVLDSPDGAPARASLLGEIVVGDGSQSHQFYDFTAKYQDDTAADLSCPAELPDEVSAEIRSQAVTAFDAVAAEGISRVDFFYDASASTLARSVVVNEINTMPGFTPISMYPQMWAATGLNYPELISELISLALRRPTGLR